jgi:hypothetical protein
MHRRSPQPPTSLHRQNTDQDAQHGRGRNGQLAQATGEGERRIRILALLNQSPRPHYTRDAKGVLERIMEKFGSWLERCDTMF